MGGHLTQLRELSRRFLDPEQDEAFWVTHDTAQSRSLLDSERHLFVPYIEERDVVGVLRTIPRANAVLRRERPDVVVSTGSAIALSFLPLARLRGIRTIFIESAAMVQGRTRTGRALQYLPGITVYTQSRPMADGRWTYIGSVFDGFIATRIPTPDPRHIVVTVGTSVEFGFRALIERVLEIVPDGVTVTWQTGVTDLTGLDIEARPWMSAAELEADMASADAVISHAGCGAALTAVTQGRLPVLVARRADRGEFNDDHQQEIVEQLASRGLAVSATTDALTWQQVVDAAGWSVERDQVSARVELGTAG